MVITQAVLLLSWCKENFMRAIWTHWDKPEHNSFRDEYEHKASMLLSLSLAKSHGYTTELYTTTSGAKFLEGFEFDKVSTVLDEISHVPQEWWAYAKIFVYALQESEFVHLDNDVYLLDPLPDWVMGRQLFFQNRENMSEGFGYKKRKEEFQKCPHKPLDYMNIHSTFNYGVVGGQNMEFFKRHKRMCDDYLFHPENKQYHLDYPNKWDSNFFFEQYFGGCLVMKMGLIRDAGVLFEDLDDRSYKMVHLWGSTKRIGENIERVIARLHRDYPEQAKWLNSTTKRTFVEPKKTLSLTIR